METFFADMLKGVGIIICIATDDHSRYAIGRLYTLNLPVTAAHMPHKSVLSFFKEHDTPAIALLSDNGQEFCGYPVRPP